MARTIITNGTVVTATDKVTADVLIEDEKIVALAAPGSHDWSGDEQIDAAGKYVIPGGIDVHTHMELPFGGTHASDTFETGTRAAAWGGTTTIVDFAVQAKGQGLMEGLETWQQKAEGNAAIDYGFHMIVGDVNEQTLKEMETAFDEGVTSYKMFMAYPGVFYSDDGQIFRAMQKAADNGSTIMMHAENGIAIDVLVEQALQRGETDPIYHGIVRKSILEGEATHRAIKLAELSGATLYIVHLSALEALEEVTIARDNGSAVFAETCPQYLLLGLDNLGNGFDGAKYVCSPPLRDWEAGHQEELWRGLRSNDLQVISTDHCPFCMDEFDGLIAQKRLGEGDFSKIPNGMPGVEPRMELTYQAGVAEGRIDLNRWVELTSTAPAKMFGLFPQKGTIAVGSDADVVIFDPDGRKTISVGNQHMRVDYSAYEGWEVSGSVDTVLSRGQVIVAAGDYRGRAGHGRYLKRGLNQYVL